MAIKVPVTNLSTLSNETSAANTNWVGADGNAP